jgi:hypothetical protein
MNRAIVAQLESYQRLLIESVVVARFVVVKKRIISDRGHIRIRATLIDGGLLEFSEHLVVEDDFFVANTYSFHWQNNQQQLVRRWDNARHHMELPHAPDHIHYADGTIEGNPKTPTLALVLRVIEQHIT